MMRRTLLAPVIDELRQGLCRPKTAVRIADSQRWSRDDLSNREDDLEGVPRVELGKVHERDRTFIQLEINTDPVSGFAMMDREMLYPWLSF